MINATAAVEHYTLDNGLEVALIHDPHAKIITLKTIVKTGSIHEDNYLGHGISHYLEHLVAGGTTSKKTEDDYIKLLSLMGGVSNAYTTTDHTAYFINTSEEFFESALNTLYEWLFFCEFKESEVDREKEVITREIEKNLANVQRTHYYLSQKNQYKTHPTRYPVIGHLDEFLTLKKEDLLSYYKSHYTASNMILVIAGNFDKQNGKELIKKTFGSQPTRTAKLLPPISESKPFNKRRIEEAAKVSSTIVSIRFATVDIFSNDLYALDLLEYILGNGNQSVLYKDIVEDKKLAYTLSTSSYTPHYVDGYFEIYFECDYENKDKVIETVFTLLNKYKNKKFDDTLIKRSRKQKLADNLFTINSIEDKANKIGSSVLYSNNTSFYETYIESFNKIKASDLQLALNNYFDEEKSIISIFYPNTIDSSQEEKELEKQEDTKLITLENGLRVLLERNTELPKINAQIMSLGGLRNETPSTNGIGQLIADLLGKKTSKLDKDDLELLFEDNAAIVEGHLGKNSLYYTLECLSEDQDLLFDTFLTSYFDAKFDTTELENAKRKLSNDIKQRNNSWYSEDMTRFTKEFFGNHPYALSKLGELSSIDALKSSDLIQHFDTILDPKTTVMYVYGDFNEKKILASIKKQSKLIHTKDSAAQSPKRELHTIASRSEQTHTHDVSSIFIGFDSIDYSDASAEFKLDLVDAILTGMSYPGGRLHKKLRDAGYVYVVHGQNQKGLEPGIFSIYALSNEKSIKDAEKIIFDEIEDIKQHKISQSEFDEAIGRMRFYYKELESDIHNKILIQSSNELYNNDFNFTSKTEDYLSTLKPEDVMETANKYLINPQTIIFRPINEN